MSSHVSFQMPMGGWTKWNSKSKLVQDLDHDVHWPSGWEVCAGDPDGTSCLPDI